MNITFSKAQVARATEVSRFDGKAVVARKTFGEHSRFCASLEKTRFGEPCVFILDAAVRRHGGFWMETPDGHDVHILGDRKMPKATRKALGAMMDAAYKAAVAGKLEVPPNAQAEARGTATSEKQKPL